VFGLACISPLISIIVIPAIQSPRMASSMSSDLPGPSASSSSSSKTPSRRSKKHHVDPVTRLSSPPVAPPQASIASRALSVLSETPYSFQNAFGSHSSQHSLRNMQAFADFPWLQGSVLAQDWTLPAEEQEDGALVLKGSFTSLYISYSPN
jgi:hypothetical protein